MGQKKLLLSVIMSIYNGERYLREAIDSILGQSFRDFELILIDDASTDSTYEIIKSYQDERIVVIQNKKNLGLTKSLNIGLQNAKGTYIARMDADDISLPDRFEKQLRYMEKHRDVALLSCSYLQFGKSSKKVIIKMNEMQLKGQLLFGSALPHPGFFFKRELFSCYHIAYNEKLRYAQDYDFQVRVSRKFKIACLPEILIKYRSSEEQISEKKFYKQRACADWVRKKQFSYYGLRCSSYTIGLLDLLHEGRTSQLRFFDILSLYVFLTYIAVRLRKSPYKECVWIVKTVLFYRWQLYKVMKENGKRTWLSAFHKCCSSRL